MLWTASFCLRVEMVEKKPYVSPTAFNHFNSHLWGGVKLFVVWKIVNFIFIWSGFFFIYNKLPMVKSARTNSGFFSTISTQNSKKT